jgi:hypothetical protein
MAKLNEIIESLIKVKENVKDENALFLVILDNEPFRITKIVGGTTVDGRKFGAIEVQITKEMQMNAMKHVMEKIASSSDDIIEKKA